MGAIGGAARDGARPLRCSGTCGLTFAFYSSTLRRVETPLMPGVSRSSETADTGFWKSVCRG
jgi:hypothetical protein